MGIEESKVSPTARSCTLHFPVSGDLKNRSWSVLYQYSLDQWKRGGGEASGFVDRILTCPNQVYNDCSPAFCINKQNIISTRKSSPIFSLRKRVKVTKMAEHFEYNHIPAQLSSIQNFHFKSVLCYHRGLVVLHLARNRVTLLGLVDIHLNKFLGVFGRQRVEFDVESVTGEISPDESRCLIQLPSARNSRVFIFQLYDLRSKDLLSELIVPVSQSTFAFDPRFTCSRLATTNFEAHSGHSAAGGSSISLINLNTWERLVSNHQTTADLPSTVHFLRLEYTRSGHLLVAVCADEAVCRCAHRDYNIRNLRPTSAPVILGGGNNQQATGGAPPVYAGGGGGAACGGGQATVSGGYPVGASVGGGSTVNFTAAGGGWAVTGGPPVTCHLLIFDADSLNRLRIIKFDRSICPLHTCPVNLRPVWSRCGGRMGLVVNALEASSVCELVLVFHLPPPGSLMSLARQKLLQVYTEAEILHLGLPTRLLDFVRFQPTFTCAGSCISRSSSTLTARTIDLS